MTTRYEYSQSEMTAIRETTSGFYKCDPDGVTLLHGRFYVINANYELHRHLNDTYTYPIDGWAWYDTEEAARTVLNLPVPLTDEEILADKLAQVQALKQELGLL